MRNFNVKIQQLVDNYNQYLESCDGYIEKEDRYSFKENVMNELENNPSFWAWFFDNPDMGEYPTLNESQKEEKEAFLESLPDFVPSEEDEDCFYFSL